MSRIFTKVDYGATDAGVSPALCLAQWGRSDHLAGGTATAVAPKPHAGLPKVQFQEVVTATALNCLRLYAYTKGVSRGITWVSHLARLKRRRQQQQAAA